MPKTTHKQNGASNNGKPLILIDFDGVINQFPDDDKVEYYSDYHHWLFDDKPHALYNPDNWYVPDRDEIVNLPGFYPLRIIWSSNLVNRLKSLDAEIQWLSTWQPFTDTLNEKLGVDWPTIHWYDPKTGEGRRHGKFNAVTRALEQHRPIVWIDDEEVNYPAQLAIAARNTSIPVFMVQPLDRIGLSRHQMLRIEGFINQPTDMTQLVSADLAGAGHIGHRGF